MKLKEFYNPKHVYDGWFETYSMGLPYFHHYADFRGRESARSAVMSLLAWLVATLGMAGILMGLVGLLYLRSDSRRLQWSGACGSPFRRCRWCRFYQKAERNAGA